MPDGATPASTGSSRFPGPANAWVDYRRKRFWAVVLLIVYTLAGFFLVPYLAHKELISLAEAELNVPVDIETVRFNPWTLTAEIDGLTVSEPDGPVIAGFDRLLVNLQVSSLFRLALTFKEVLLENPYAQVTRHADGSLNVDPIIAGSDEPPPADDEQPGDPLRLLIQQLSVVGGSIEATDEMRNAPITTSIGPINISVNNLTTLPDREGRQQVLVDTPRGARLEWDGTIELNPLVSSGRVTGSGPYLPIIYQYFEEDLNVQLTEGNVDLAFEYAIAVDPDSGLQLELTNGRSTLRNASLTMSDEDGERLQISSLPEITMAGLRIAWPAQEASIEQLALTDPTLLLWLENDGTLNTDRLLVTTETDTRPADTAAADTPAESDAATPPWSLSLADFRINNLSAEFVDRSLDEDGQVSISDLNLRVTDITNRDEDAFPVDLTLAVAGGTIAAKGEVVVLPEVQVTAEVDLDGLKLATAQPWVAEVANLAVADGTLDAGLKIDVSPEETLGVDGKLSVSGLDVTDTSLDERLVGWARLDIDRLAFSGSDAALEVSEVTLAQPYLRLRIAEDQSTNFDGLAKTSDAPADAGAAEAETEASGTAEADSNLAVTVSRITIDDGSADFSDLSLPLPFAANITELEGEITTLASASENPASIKLAGAVDEFGLAEINGKLSPLDPTKLTDITILFRNVGMPGLSPYTIKFVGQEIDDGRMDLDLRYLVEDGRLRGENGIVIRELQLGDKVEHPDAANVPLGLAVALLTGPDGTIDLDMPVSGNVNDPEFSVGGIVLGAFVNLITKAATAPFKLLGKLVGAESEDFDVIEFRAGEAELTPPEQEKLLKLSEALAMRPTLALELAGVSDPQADAAALKTARVTAEIEQQVAAQGDDGDALLSERRQQIVESLARERLTGIDYKALEQEHQIPKDADKPDGRQVLDAPAYAAALEALLVEAETVSAEDLDALAAERAQAISATLTDTSAVTPNRIVIAETGEAQATDQGWVPMELKLGSAAKPQSSVSN